jgi:metal-sulfur cluster biosynthetic enzyme
MRFLHRRGSVVEAAAVNDSHSAQISSAETMSSTGWSITRWLQDQADDSMVHDLLKSVIDPEIGIDIINLGLVYEIVVSSDGIAHIRMTLTTPGCPLSSYIENAIHDVLWGAPGLSDVDLQIVWDPPWDTDMLTSQAKRELGWPW